MDDVTERRERAKLEETRRLLDEIVSSLEEAVLITEPAPEGRVVTMANPAAERIFRYGPGELVGVPSAALHPDPAGRLDKRAGVLAQLRDGARVQENEPLRRKDGTVFEAEQTIAVLDRDDAGEPTRLLNVVRDVSEARRAEAELRASDARFRRIAERIEQVFWISGPDGELEYVSPAYRKIWGRSPEAVVEGRDRWIESVLPSDRGRVEETLSRPATTGHEIEYRIVRPDGEIRWIRDRAFPVEEPDEGAGRMIGVAEDITERKRAEERFSVLSQEIADLVYVVAPDGTILMASPSVEGFAGYSLDEFVGGDAFEWVHPEDREGLIRTFDSMVAEPGAVARAQYRIPTKDGDVRHVESVARNRLDHPAIRGIVVTTRDISERLLLEKQLRQSQKMEAVGRLAGGIAHDFNNLLTVIRSQTDLLLMDLPEGSPLGGEVRGVQEAADRAARLTSQLLSFSRDQVLRPRTVDLSEVVGGMGGLLERIIGEDIVVSYRLAGDLRPVRVDPGQLEQAVLNLAVNARDAMPAGGELTLSTRHEIVDPEMAAELAGLEPGAWVTLEVRDTGTGMEEEVRSRIFEPFFTTKGTGKGTGLGLSMVYGFLKQSGGAIHVESRPGEGAAFFLRFPEASGDVEAARGTPGVAGGTLRVRARVLVVEDDPDVRRVTARILQRQGLEVETVGNAEEGLRALEGGGFDLLLTDLVLPEMSGLVLVDRVRDSRPDVRVVVMSGYAEGSPGHRGDLPDDVAFVQKPFTPDGLVEVVRGVLREG